VKSIFQLELPTRWESDMLTSINIIRGVLLLAVVLLAGCGDNTKVVSVSGTLTRNGKPVPYMTIHFVPENGRMSWGVSDENGRYSLKQDNKTPGVLTGAHTVWVEWRPLSPQEEMDPKQAKKPQELAAIQEKYGSEKKSPLKIEVTKAAEDLEIKLD
jgi:hypothetical protein